MFEWSKYTVTPRISKREMARIDWFLLFFHGYPTGAYVYSGPRRAPQDLYEFQLLDSLAKAPRPLSVASITHDYRGFEHKGKVYHWFYRGQLYQQFQRLEKNGLVERTGEFDPSTRPRQPSLIWRLTRKGKRRVAIMVKHLPVPG
jgi:hypothetical protein